MAPAVPLSTVLSAIAVLVLIGLSAFFSSSETAIFTLPETWSTQRTPGEDPRTDTLRHLREDPHRLLVTILVGNNIVNVAIASITTVLATEYLPAGSAVSVATVVASFLILIFGEIVPKSYGLGHATTWALAVARPITAVERALYPVVVTFDTVTRWLNARIGGETGIEQPYVD